MSGDSLIVPVAIPSGSLHFATVSSDCAVEDVIRFLLINGEGTSEVLGDLEEYGWAMQRIRKEPTGRQWEEEELESLGNGLFCISEWSSDDLLTLFDT